MSNIEWEVYQEMEFRLGQQDTGAAKAGDIHKVVDTRLELCLMIYQLALIAT